MTAMLAPPPPPQLPAGETAEGNTAIGVHKMCCGNKLIKHVVTLMPHILSKEEDFAQFKFWYSDAVNLVYFFMFSIYACIRSAIYI